MTVLESLGFGLAVAVTPVNLFYCLVGATVGTFVGVLPGIGPLATIAILLPLTFGLDGTTALIMLAGVFYGAMYGGSTASILVNVPGTASAAVACFDGYPMAQQGRAAPALVISTLASFFAGTVAIVFMAALAPPLAKLALSFGSAEYFSLMMAALVVAAFVSEGDMLRSLGMVVFGLVLGIAGTDTASGTIRFGFGVQELADGVHFVVVAMGMFGLAEIFRNLEQRGVIAAIKRRFRWRELVPSPADLRASWGAVLRGTGLGCLIGPLPGVGTGFASFMAYAVEKKLSRTPERFGKGAIEGVAAPEAANNATAQTAFVPLLTLGIPGDAVTAMMLGALTIHGIAPGPDVIVRYPELFWGLIASMWIGNLFLLILNLPLIGIWVRMLSIPYYVLFPTIVLFVCIGVYSLRNSVFDVAMTGAFGVLGYLLLKIRCPPAPLLLGFILGPMIEQHFRRAMLLARGDAAVFVREPISLAFLAIAVALVTASIWSAFWRVRPQPAGKH